MTPERFVQARLALCLTQAELGAILNVTPKTIALWEGNPPNGWKPGKPPKTASRVMEWMLAGYRPPQWPAGTPDAGYRR